MHGSRGQHKNTLQPLRACTLLNALEQALAVALRLTLRGDGEGGHFACALFRVGVERGAAKNNTVVLDDGVVRCVAFDFGPIPLDQDAFALQGFNQRDDAAHIINGRLSQAF